MFVDGFRRSRGMSMVEILAVLTIVGILSAIAAPAFWKMGMFSTDKVSGSARELYALMRAAKVYAAANGCEAGLAYGAPVKPIDPMDDTKVDVIPVMDVEIGALRRLMNTVFMVRALTDREKASLGKTGNWYVPLQNPNGNIEPMLKNTCVYLDVQPYNPMILAAPSEFGLSAIQVCELDGLPMFEWQPGVPAKMFEAHVFKPSGMMKTTAAKQRFRVYVGLDPDQNPSQRFTDTATGREEVLRTLELYATTGRVKVAG
jgi:prepilin-type N-terminal cleavage/methylation domain-containing protein